MKILLVAKPWRGGLAAYLKAAIEALVPGSVQWLPTYPLSFPERIAYRRDRSAWRRRLARRVEESRFDAAIFINHLADFEALKPRDEYTLWITDDPRPVAGRNPEKGSSAVMRYDRARLGGCARELRRVRRPVSSPAACRSARQAWCR